MKIIDGNNYNPLAAAYDAAEGDIKVTMGSEPAFVYARAGRAPRIIGGVGTDALARYYRAIHAAHVLGTPDGVIVVGYTDRDCDYVPEVGSVDLRGAYTLWAPTWNGVFYITGKPGEKKVEWFGRKGRWFTTPAPRTPKRYLEKQLQQLQRI